ncbi:MAG: hypothetical protein ABIR70_17840 [Bryobacteraceae bacterium]
MRRPVLGKTTAGILVGVSLLLLAWIRMYPDPRDPWNIRYVLWKSGLNPSMNLDDALDAMVGDPEGRQQV